MYALLYRSRTLDGTGDLGKFLHQVTRDVMRCGGSRRAGFLRFDEAKGSAASRSAAGGRVISEARGVFLFLNTWGLGMIVPSGRLYTVSIAKSTTNCVAMATYAALQVKAKLRGIRKFRSFLPLDAGYTNFNPL